MSYTVMSPQPANLLPNETALKLASGDCVAASVSIVQGADGNPIVTAHVRVINSDGTLFLDTNKNAVASTYSVSATPAQVAACSTMAGLQKCALMAVLGETAIPLVLASTVQANLSIANKLAAAKLIETPSVATLLGP